jgi:adenosine kinase
MTDAQIFFIGNPLLDISVDLNDKAILEKYELQEGHASLASEKQMPLYDELWNMEGRAAIPGGSALNSARSCNWLLSQKAAEKRVTYFGAIGTDEKGQTLEQGLVEVGINANLHKDAETATGTCAVIVVNKNRTLCANLAAACKYSSEHLATNMQVLSQAKIIYTTSFFITSNKDALLKVAEYATDNNIPFAFNLSAVFLLMFELDTVLKALTHADYVFCNEDEADQFLKVQNIEGGRREVAVALAKFQKTKQNLPRVAVVTQGPLPVIVATAMPGEEEVKVEEYPVEALSKDEIVDTNGAGDAFVGGFLAMLYQGRPVEECVKGGIYLSREVVTRSGCTFPEECKFE